MNMIAIFAVMNTTKAVVKRRPEKNCTGIAKVMGSNPASKQAIKVVFITAKIAIIFSTTIVFYT